MPAEQGLVVELGVGLPGESSCVFKIDLVAGVCIHVDVERDGSTVEPCEGAVLAEEPGVQFVQGIGAAAGLRWVTADEIGPFPGRLIPYYAWCNRGQVDMTVWIPLQ